MFCNNCGSKLTKEDKICRVCGTPADQNETCGGFWGLVGQVPPIPVEPEPQPQPGPQPQPQPKENPGSKGKRSMLFWYLLPAALALLALLLLIWNGFLLVRLNALSVEAATLRQQLEAAESREETTSPATTPETTVPEATVPETTIPETSAPSGEETSGQEETGAAGETEGEHTQEDGAEEQPQPSTGPASEEDS